MIWGCTEWAAKGGGGLSICVLSYVVHMFCSKLAQWCIHRLNVAMAPSVSGLRLPCASLCPRPDVISITYQVGPKEKKERKKKRTTRYHFNYAVGPKAQAART